MCVHNPTSLSATTQSAKALNEHEFINIFFYLQKMTSKQAVNAFDRSDQWLQLQHNLRYTVITRTYSFSDVTLHIIVDAFDRIFCHMPHHSVHFGRMHYEIFSLITNNNTVEGHTCI